MEEKQNKEQELDTVYRWYELNRYDENVPEGQKGKIQSNLEETFSTLLNSLRKMAEELDIKGFEGITLEEAKKVCEEQKISLGDYLGEIFKEFIKNPTPEAKEKLYDYVENKIRSENEMLPQKETLSKEDILKGAKGKLTEEEIDEKIKKAKEKISFGMAEYAEQFISEKAPPQVKAYVQAYLDAFAAYGPGARDNVVTAMVISGGVQHEGEENKPYSTNARYGCGFGKTGVSQGVAMGKMSIGKRGVITSSTPELAGQSFSELLEGFAKRDMTVVYVAEGEVRFLKKNPEIRKNEKGKEEIVTEVLTEPEEIKMAMEYADVVVSDLTALVKAKEAGLYEPNRDRDSLLQDEQDSDMFHNLWSVEIKGEEYSKEDHDSRISARKSADALVQSFINNNSDKVSGNKVKQSVSIDGRPPEINIEGKSVKFEGISIGVPKGIQPIEFAEFIMDSLLARGLYTDKGIDYVIKDDKVEAISPSTGGKNNIPEGVIQALAIKEGIEDVQPEKIVKKVVSKMTFLKEMFGEISGMSATYGMDPKQFLQVVSQMGLSQDLIEVMQLQKESRLPSFENLKEEEKKPTICKKEAEKEIDLQATITMSDGTQRTITCPSPYIAAIVNDIEDEENKDKAIIIGTDNREKTIELVKALFNIYGPDKVEGYSSVPDENVIPPLKAPPNPAIPGQKLNIGVGKIVVGDHCIGRGVTPAKPDEQKTKKDKVTGEVIQEGKKEHLIMAQMPSRSEGLLEQFLGRVGRKDEDGSVSFILQEDDPILEEFKQLNDGKEPEDILEVIESVYPEKTKDAIDATRGDIELGKKAYRQADIINTILMLHGDELGLDVNKPEEFLDKLKDAPEDIQKGIISEIEGALKYFQKFITLKTKQLKGESEINFEAVDVVNEYLETEKNIVIGTKGVDNREDKSGEIEEMSVGSRYSQIKAIYERAVELSKLMEKDDRDIGAQHPQEDGRG